MKKIVTMKFPAMTSVDTILDDLSYRSLYKLCAKWLYEPSEHDRDVEKLRFTVREGYEDERIPPWAIREQADDDRDARLQAANRIIRDLTLDVAEKHARIKELEALLELAGLQHELAGQVGLEPTTDGG